MKKLLLILLCLLILSLVADFTSPLWADLIYDFDPNLINEYNDTGMYHTRLLIDLLIQFLTSNLLLIVLAYLILKFIFSTTNNNKILLLALAPILLLILSTFIKLSSNISLALAAIFIITAILTTIYSIYINLTTNISSWDWKNYFAIIGSFCILIAIFMLFSNTFLSIID